MDEVLKFMNVDKEKLMKLDYEELERKLITTDALGMVSERLRQLEAEKRLAGADNGSVIEALNGIIDVSKSLSKKIEFILFLKDIEAEDEADEDVNEDVK